MTNEPLLNRNHKDALFRFIFKNPKDLLSLYNALNDTDYTDVSDLTVTTLEDIVYMSYKNDISFILGSEMSLFEHQSTFNPNMPLRGLFYFSTLYKKYVAENNIDIYSSKRAQIPIPRYIIFYNGRQEMPERCTLRLSDAFSKVCDTTEDKTSQFIFQPAMEITAAGNAIGAAKRAPPAAANAIPIVRKVLKNFGVGALTRSTTVISFGLVVFTFSFFINVELNLHFKYHLSKN